MTILESFSLPPSSPIELYTISRRMHYFSHIIEEKIESILPREKKAGEN
jgi:hypothetical protein